jgi:hypothetical protein
MKILRTPLNLVLAAALLAITLYGFLAIPADALLPVRWGMHGEVAASMVRNLALIQMPVATALIWLIVFVVMTRGTLRPQTTTILVWLVPALTALFALLQLVIVLIGLGIAVPFFQPN